MAAIPNSTFNYVNNSCSGGRPGGDDSRWPVHGGGHGWAEPGVGEEAQGGSVIGGSSGGTASACRQGPAEGSDGHGRSKKFGRCVLPTQPHDG